MKLDVYIFDREAIDLHRELVVRYALPYSDLEHMPADQLRRAMHEGWALEHSHSLEDQIGGQCGVGFVITAFYEDRFSEESGDFPSRYMPVFYATRAVKPMV